jgi:hypothetical protein
MMTVIRIVLLALCVLWLPLGVVWVPIVMYTMVYGWIAPITLAILIDWYYVAPVPYTVLFAAAAALVVPFVQSRTMFYTT